MALTTVQAAMIGGGNATAISPGVQIYLNTQTISTSYTIPANTGAFSVGPITYANGAAVTVSPGSKWVIM